MRMKERQKSEEKKEHKKPWREYTATVEDIRSFLSDRVFLRRNVRDYVVVGRSAAAMLPIRRLLAPADDTETPEKDVF